MKKVLSVIFALTLIFAVCIPTVSVAAAMVNPSPEGTGEYDVRVRPNPRSKGTVTKKSLENGDYEFTAEPYEGQEFFGWRVEGGEVIFIQGDVHSRKIIVRLKGDVEVVGCFTAAAFAGEEEPGDQSDKAPKTGDNSYWGLIGAFSAMFLAAGILAKKRVFAK